jgi:hypothetical protein
LWDLKKRIPLNSLYINVFLLHLLCFKKKRQFNFLLVIPNENNIIKKKKEKYFRSLQMAKPIALGFTYYIVL